MRAADFGKTSIARIRELFESCRLYPGFRFASPGLYPSLASRAESNMTQTEKTPLYSWYALAVLMVVYILNFLDRTIIYLCFR
jgi:hypothetical protein